MHTNEGSVLPDGSRARHTPSHLARTARRRSMVPSGRRGARGDPQSLFQYTTLARSPMAGVDGVLTATAQISFQAAEHGDLRDVDRVLTELAGDPRPESRAWQLALEAVRWSFDPSRGPAPRLDAGQGPRFCASRRANSLSSLHRDGASRILLIRSAPSRRRGSGLHTELDAGRAAPLEVAVMWPLPRPCSGGASSSENWRVWTRRRRQSPMRHRARRTVRGPCRGDGRVGPCSWLSRREAWSEAIELGAAQAARAWPRRRLFHTERIPTAA